MIAKAEKLSNVEEDKLNCKRHNDKNKHDLYRTSDSGMKNVLRLSSKSRSTSKTRTQENEKHKISNYQGYIEQQHIRTYQKSKDNNDDLLNQTTEHKFSSNHIGKEKNWKKKNGEKKCETITSLELKKTTIEVYNPNNINEVEKSKSILTEAEMNKLGAKIIKAELMGDNVC